MKNSIVLFICLLSLSLVGCRRQTVKANIEPVPPEVEYEDSGVTVPVDLDQTKMVLPKDLMNVPDLEVSDFDRWVVVEVVSYDNRVVKSAWEKASAPPQVSKQGYRIMIHLLQVPDGRWAYQVHMFDKPCAEFCH